MAARTSPVHLGALAALGIALTAGPTGAQPATPVPVTDEEILGDDDSWKIENVALRTVYLDQRGHGYQSQAGPQEGPGSEEMWVIEPWAQIQLRQSARVRHEVTIPVDVVSAASPDALDAVSSASRVNEAVGTDIRTTIQTSDTDTITTRVGFHWEEPLTSGTLGAGWRRSLADDNAAIAVNGSLTVDGFDVTDQVGTYLHKGGRSTASANVSVSQILSPTTVVDATYGATWQHGTLAQTWNAVPVMNAQPVGELFPRDRLRHAIAGRIAQHVPLTRSTFKAWVRHYRDDFGLSANTVELSGYQYLVPWLYTRVAYRFHRQGAVDFFTAAMATAPGDSTVRTADSDLAAFDAHEVGAGLSIVPARAPHILRHWSVTVDYARYHRTNDLTIDVVALGLGRLF